MATNQERIELIADGADATRRIGEAVGRWVPAGAVLLLHGDLGAGKTTLTQGIAVGLGIVEPVQSPTFTLVAEHEGTSLRLYHLDLYRLTGPDELETLGFGQFLDPDDAVTVIEWPERAGRWLPPDYLLIELMPSGPDRRIVTLRAAGSVQDWRALAETLQANVTTSVDCHENGSRE